MDTRGNQIREQIGNAWGKAATNKRNFIPQTNCPFNLRPIFAGPSTKVDLLPIGEERLGDLDLDLLRLKPNSESEESAISKEIDDTSTLEKSFKR